MKLIKSCFNKILILTLLVALLYTTVFLTTQKAVFNVLADDGEKKVYSTATLEDNFSDERVLVVLKKEVSLSQKIYRKNDFNEVASTDIVNLTNEVALKNIRQKKEYNYFAENGSEELKNFRQVLSIELENKSKESVLSAIKVLQARDDIYYVGPDYEISICSTTPNDTYYVNGNQWAIDKISLPQAWDTVKGSSSVIVGVVDSGIDGPHEDLKEQIDYNLCRDFTSGAEVIINNPSDPSGHGTVVAGIIGAKGNNGKGISGACWNVKLASLRVFDSKGYGYSSYVVQAINFAIKNNIKVLNFSGAWINSTISKYYDIALDTAIGNYFGLFVCSAGNSSDNNDNFIHYPSNYRLSNLIAVAATDINDKKCEFSNYGKLAVDIFAPGVNILSTKKGGGYEQQKGTSFSAPFVSGVAALIYSLYPNIPAKIVKNIILDNVDKISNLSDKCVSGGRLNAYKAIQNAHPKHIYTISYDFIDEQSHLSFCYCGASTTENHKFNTYQKYNNNFHMVKCECGAQKQAVHKFVTYNIAGHEVTQCPLCGQYKYSQIIIPDLNSLSLEEYLLSLSGEAVTTCGE